MSKIVLLLALFGSIFTAQPSFAQSIFSYDDWTEMLNKSDSSLPSYSASAPTDLIQKVAEAVKRHPRPHAAFSLIKNYFSKFSFTTAADFSQAASDLIKIRQSVRDLPNVRKDLLYLLQQMAEEPLVVGLAKFNDFPKTLQVVNEESKTSLEDVYSLNGVKVQSGDVFIFRSVGDGSSSFIALSLNDKYIASHTAIAYVTKDGKLLSPEAYIEDGVLIRNLLNDILSNDKARIFIYRLKNSNLNIFQKVVGGLKSFIAEMYQRVADPTKKAAFPYSTKLAPEDGAYDCVGVVYEIYKRAGLPDSLNPFSKTNWSGMGPRTRNLFDALGITAEKAPAPGGVEANPNFELVTAIINANNLPQERIESAIVESLIYILGTSNYAQKLEIALKSIGNRPLEKGDIQKLVDSGVLSPKTKAALETHMDQIPNDVNIKQLLFFYMLNEQLTPQLRTALTEKYNESLKQNHVMGPDEIQANVNQMAKAALKPLADKLTAILGQLNMQPKTEPTPQGKAKRVRTTANACANLFS